MVMIGLSPGEVDVGVSGRISTRDSGVHCRSGKVLREDFDPGDGAEELL